MRVLDLFSGTGGWSAAFLDRGHDVLRIDNDPYFRDVPNTVIADVRDPIDRNFDVILASPPCQAFSLASVRHHFEARATCDTCHRYVVRLSGEKWSSCCSRQRVTTPPTRTPKSDFARLSLELLQRTYDIISNVHPRFWWMENPRATMQHFVPPMVGGRSVAKTTVMYCQYGDTSQKATHLFGAWPDEWTSRPECEARPGKMPPDAGPDDEPPNVKDGMVLDENGQPCHQWSKRGAKTGTQGKNGARDRAIVPYELSLEVCRAVEEAMG